MSDTPVSPVLRSLPNALTIARLAAIPVFVVLLISENEGPSWPAGILFGAAAFTDQLDGFLARRWHVESAFGKVAFSRATWGIYASLGFVLVTEKGTQWPIVCFWINLGLAVLAALQYIQKARREVRRPV